MFSADILSIYMQFTPFCFPNWWELQHFMQYMFDFVTIKYRRRIDIVSWIKPALVVAPREAPMRAVILFCKLSIFGCVHRRALSVNIWISSRNGHQISDGLNPPKFIACGSVRFIEHELELEGLQPVRLFS